MHKLVLFNNKGGVGKTTLTANLCAYLALKKSYRVLVVDCDPQCNITQLFLGDDRTIDLYWSEVSDGSTKSQTLLDAVRPIMDGGAEVDTSIGITMTAFMRSIVMSPQEIWATMSASITKVMP